MSRKLPANLAKFTKLQFDSFLKSFDTVLTDCDGVLWRSNDVLKDSNKVINRFIDMNKKVYFVTNNSTRTREELAEKARMLNFNVGLENIISTAYLAAQYLKQQNFNKKVYVVGGSGIAKELDAVGIKHFGVGPDILPGGPLMAYMDKNIKDPDVGAVVVGFDEHLSVPKLLKAATFLDDKSTLFIATNTDERFPMPHFIIPGTGTMVRAIETCSERKAIVMGKPENHLCDLFFGDEIRTKSQRFLMIGDRLNTDILFGKRNNFQTLFVESGVHLLEDVQKIAKELDDGAKDEQKDLINQIPDFYLPALGDFFNNFKS